MRSPGELPEPIATELKASAEEMADSIVGERLKGRDNIVELLTFALTEAYKRRVLDDKATARSAEVREGASFIGPPEWAGNIVSMTQFSGAVYVACQHAMFRIEYVDGEAVLTPLRFASPAQQT